MTAFKRLLQVDDHTCLPTCLAMIVGESVDYVLDWLGGGTRLGGFSSEDAIIFLAHHGIYLSTYAAAKEDKCLKLNLRETLSIEFKLKGRPVLLTVKSERFPGKLHSVFFDGYKVFDPNPEVKELRDISEYDIIEYWPMIVTDVRWKKFTAGGR